MRDTEFEVTVHVVGETRQVVVEVTDAAGGHPTPQEPAADAPHGRGLHIVKTLADAWGIDKRRDRPGKTVWFSSTCPPATARGASRPAQAWASACAARDVAAHDAGHPALTPAGGDAC